MAFVCGEEEIAVRAIIGRLPDDLVELREEVDRVARHGEVDGRRELRAHTAHAFARRALPLMRLALDDKYVAATTCGQMISHARPDDAAADDNYVCCVHKNSSVVGGLLSVVCVTEVTAQGLAR